MTNKCTIISQIITLLLHVPTLLCHLQRARSQYQLSYTSMSMTVWHNSVEKCKVKLKVTLVQALRLCTGRTAHRESRGIALPFDDHGTRKGWEVSVTPRPLFTPGKTRYPLYRRLRGPQGRSGQVRKISPPPGFDNRTVQPVASRYTDYATRATTLQYTPLFMSS